MERDKVLILESKLRDVRAHKGMLFSTAGFQKGALKYADARGIATVTVSNGRFIYETKGADSQADPPPWVNPDRLVGIRVYPTPAGVGCHTFEEERMDGILEWLN